MTDEQAKEYHYRYEERLAILLGDAPSTAEARAIAKSEADAWLFRQLREQIDQMCESSVVDNQRR